MTSASEFLAVWPPKRITGILWNFAVTLCYIIIFNCLKNIVLQGKGEIMSIGIQFLLGKIMHHNK